MIPQYIISIDKMPLSASGKINRKLLPSPKEFITKNIIKELPAVLKNKLYRDPKSTFQEQAQDRVGITPTYGVIEESGPDHDRHFVVGVYLEEELVAEGGGSSKQEAQEGAAQKALEVKGW